MKNTIPTVPTTLEILTTGQTHCPGENITYKCTVGGNTVIWYTPEGYISEDCSGCSGNSGKYYWTILDRAENSTTLESTLTFILTTSVDIGCGNTNVEELVSIQVQVEGILVIHYNYNISYTYFAIQVFPVLLVSL